MTDLDVLLVRGAARRAVAPEHAILVFTVSASAAAAGDVERKVAEAAAMLDTALDAHAAVVGARHATSIRIRPNRYWHPESGRQVQDGFVGDRALQVRVTDPTATGAVLRAAFDAGDVEVAGPAWELGDGHPVYTEVRAAAAADARARAEAYASGLGVKVGSVAFVAEPGLRIDGGGAGGAPRAMAKMAMAESADAGGESPDVGFPAEVEVSAAVEVAFHLDR